MIIAHQKLIQMVNPLGIDPCPEQKRAGVFGSRPITKFQIILYKIYNINLQTKLI